MNDYQRVMEFLKDGGWQRAQMISLILGISPREMRELAESTGAFIGGNQGYKRADLATAEELEHAGRSLCSRGAKTTRRGRTYIKKAATRRQDLGPLFANLRG